MSKDCTRSNKVPSYLAFGAGGILALSVGVPLHAAQTEDTEKVETVTVTGTLIPTQKDVNVPTPVITISQDDLQAQGFTSVSDALQHASFATGQVQGPQYSGGFTQGAQTLSLFGLDPSYTKFLIDGRPLGDYPALYNGTENFNSISGIPVELVDHIDILPGGQSSIYGSDAIAGVVNIVMKKKLDGPVADVRYGWTKDGGGTDKRFALADSLTFGNFTLVGGLQYENTAPIWGYQRPLTASHYLSGTSPVVATRDFLVSGYAGNYYFLDPANCGNVSGLFGGTIGLQTRAGHGQFCGTTHDGDYTINNGDSGIQGYFHATYDVNDHMQIYADTLLNHDVVSDSVGPLFYANDQDANSPFYYYEDPNLEDFMILQHVFSSEEAGGLKNTMNEQIVNAQRTTLGIMGTLGASSWAYDINMTYDQEKLDERTHILFTAPLEAYFSQIMGPSLGYDAANFAYVYTPDYASFYNPVSPSDYAGFSGYATSHSYTERSLARAQLANPSLFQLPGGNAGIAVAIEGGDEGWNYAPDPGYLDGTVFAYTATAGSGHRSRYAGTGELRLPLFSMLSITASGRYDKYNVTGGDFTKFTYNIGADFKPLKGLSFRARYGTAFKAPTLADEFQGPSGFFQTVTDYYTCAKQGFSGVNLGNCSLQYLDDSVQGTTEGNPDLKPITAKVWDVGIVWQPLERVTITSDFMHWGISNEVEQQNSSQLLITESECRLGQLDINSPTCVDALSKVTRNAVGDLQAILTPKVNVAQETVNTVLTTFKFVMPAGKLGTFTLGGAWTDMIKHTTVQFPGDDPIDALGDPSWSQEFKSKLDGALTWDFGPLSSTVYVERFGQTPNYLATIDGYNTPGAGRLGQYTLTNFTARYQVTPGLYVTATVDNMFGTMPPVDHSYPGTAGTTSVEAYDIFDYNVYGRQYFLEVNYKFMK